MVRWRSAGQLLYTNWLNYYLYQTTPYDLSKVLNGTPGRSFRFSPACFVKISFGFCPDLTNNPHFAILIWTTLEKGLPRCFVLNKFLSYGSQKIIDDISFEIQEGQMAVLIGSSGCGKTTTMKMINRLIEPTSGKIYINGKDIAAQDRVELRRHIGYVIQQIGLFPNMTVAQNICVVPNLLKYSKEACDKIVHELLELVNLPYEQYAHKYPPRCPAGSSSASAFSVPWPPRPHRADG